MAEGERGLTPEPSDSARLVDAAYSGQASDATSYFTDKTDAYHRFRPDYPSIALRFALADTPTSVLIGDMGCGTGISSRALARFGGRVIGVEPNTAMRNRAIAAGPADLPITYRKGTAEATGMESSSIDVVFCGQSFHWFESASALREFHRVLKPGGRLVLAWNIRDESDSAACEYERIIRLTQAEARKRGRLTAMNRSGDPTEGGYFHNPRTQSFNNPARYDLESFLGRARSSSYFPDSGALQDRLEAMLRRLFLRFERDGNIELAQQCWVTVADRVD